jgi:hypothetical protein
MKLQPARRPRQGSSILARPTPSLPRKLSLRPHRSLRKSLRCEVARGVPTGPAIFALQFRSWRIHVNVVKLWSGVGDCSSVPDDRRIWGVGFEFTSDVSGDFAVESTVPGGVPRRSGGRAAVNKVVRCGKGGGRFGAEIFAFRLQQRISTRPPPPTRFAANLERTRQCDLFRSPTFRATRRTSNYLRRRGLAWTHKRLMHRNRKARPLESSPTAWAKWRSPPTATMARRRPAR